MNSAVRLLFHEVADLTRSEREKLFAERQIAPDLRAEIESLLSFDSTNNHRLTESVANATEELLNSDNVGMLHWGPYRRVRVLGTGGMGTVYLAERTDGEIQQQVAVKVLRADVDRPAWRDRFLKERQLLAYLNHPSIARLIDAGHTSDDRPYLVMEYVDGIAIDVYADKIGLRDQLALFLLVCDAVSHAHSRLIIHRDLKPSNILVESSGQPKLLDFGIAKLLDKSQDPTQTADRLMTPNYASPEQLRGETETTGSDIYSLGAVLYKILTGRSPNQSESANVPAIDVIAGTRKITPPSRLKPGLASDIDYILLKALRGEPNERYSSVEAFANDIRAFLERRPVAARSGDGWYKVRRFLRRRWIPVTAAAVTIVGLGLGLYVANRERAIAQRRFLEVRQIANKLFDIDAQASQLPGSTKTRQLIVDTSLDYLRRLSTDVHRDPGLALELSQAYLQVARVQGVSSERNLGQMDQADQNLRNADQLVQSVLAAQPENRTAFLRSAQISHDRMILASLQGGRRDIAHRAEVLALARKSAESLDKFNAGKQDTHEVLDEVLGIYLNVADQHLQRRDFDGALRLCDRASGLARSMDDRLSLAMFLWVAAEVFQQRADLDEAFKTIHESVQLLDGGGKTSLVRTMDLAHVLIWEGRILGQDNGISMGRSDEAAMSLERAFQITDEVVHKDPHDQSTRARLGMAGVGLADILRYSDPQHALAVYDHTLRHLAEIHDNVVIRRFEVENLAGSTYPLRRLGRAAEARRRLDGAFERLSQLKVYPSEKVSPGSVTFKSLRALADWEGDNGNIPHAIETYKKLLDQIQAAKLDPETLLEDALDLSNIYKAMADLYNRSGSTAQAQATSELRTELWRTWDRKLPQNHFIRRQLEAVGR